MFLGESEGRGLEFSSIMPGIFFPGMGALLLWAGAMGDPEGRGPGFAVAGLGIICGGLGDL